VVVEVLLELVEQVVLVVEVLTVETPGVVELLTKVLMEVVEMGNHLIMVLEVEVLVL
jgi:hypothetical protein